MSPFFDPLRCPICDATLPVRPLRCLSCGVDLIGPPVLQLAETLQRADLLADRLRAELRTREVSQSLPLPKPIPLPQLSQPGRPDASPPARSAPSLFAGRSVGVILLVLGALCLLAAGAVFIAVEWMLLPLAVRTLILIAITASFALFVQRALSRGLQATAEAMAVVASGMFVLDLAAARRARLLGLAELAAAPFEILVGVLLVGAAGAGALAVRRGRCWLRSLDAAVALGMAAAVFGALRLPEDPDEYAAASVALTVILSALYVGWRRLRFPVARWSALALGAATWLTAVALGSGRAVEQVGAAPFGDDVARLTSAWPALAVALLAGLWSTRIHHLVWRRLAAGLCLLPVLLVFEIVGWSHGWVVGAVVVLAGYVVAALACGLGSVVWSPAAGACALVLALSSVVGLLPTMSRLEARLDRPFDPLTGDVAPWLLPLTTLAVLALLPRVTVGRYRFSPDRRNTAGAFVATLGVLPILWGASFWVSMTTLIAVAALLILAAGMWRSDVLLLLGVLLLAIMRVLAYHDGFADPLAWTIIAVAALAWASTESRLAVWVGFLTASGLFALLGAEQWLTFGQLPRPFQGLVIVAIGSLGLLASQGLADRATTTSRLVGEGLSVTWVVAGLATADRSPSQRALELTIAGVAAGITGYLSQDRRQAGWVSGVLLTIASWIRLADSDIQAVEWYTLPAASALLVYGVRRLRLDTGESTWRCLGPGLTLALVPSLLLALGEPVSWRGLAVGLACVALLALGVRARLAAPFALGVLGTGLLALRNIWPVAAFLPRWTLLFLIGAVLLATGMTWESRVKDVRTAGRYVHGLR